MPCADGVPQQQGGRARHTGPSASGSGHFGCNAGCGFRSAPNDTLKFRPLAAA